MRAPGDGKTKKIQPDINPNNETLDESIQFVFSGRDARWSWECNCEASSSFFLFSHTRLETLFEQSFFISFTGYISEQSRLMVVVQRFMEKRFRMFVRHHNVINIRF